MQNRSEPESTWGGYPAYGRAFDRRYFEALIGDKAFDNNWLRAILN
jgi:hypothetical protein